MRADSVSIRALAAFPEVRAGDDLALLIADGARASGIEPRDGDVFVVAQKIVSKAEDRYVDLATVVPSARAIEIAHRTGKDARVVDVILGESRRVVRAARDVLIVEHRLGFVMANAGVDHSNVGDALDGHVLRLPEDPDASAARLADALRRQSGVAIGVIINDSFGRAWRIGSVGVAIGVAGLPALVDLRGMPDRYGRRLQATVVGYADEIAAAASLVMGQAGEGQPVVVVRGLRWSADPSPARSLVRPAGSDLFR
jgi:coenzyme F420-0:L-glutamate ligase/coenzyme F420-1:gamma-L-glutamate ligase